ncbi:hypothetical protein C7T35_15275 [Variovorax sp. WS11]|uniref:hypothetical protein n=1 Tax=Variovorax sp. WS11 TaxID=1105204 RepID=UPI000D0D19A0|nr:hypothetical protein [Variovorax sp. WS11]NDZ12077.1 hypothetical protein [Variovorax sp. WS11]PSL83742.1 hypothetical protein C7T35_15275 [Variovorax sp. WS11]
MNTVPARKRALRLVPAPEGTIDADMVAFTIMDWIDREYPTFWEAHPKIARVSVRNTIVRAVMAEAGKR